MTTVPANQVAAWAREENQHGGQNERYDKYITHKATCNDKIRPKFIYGI